MNWWNILKNTKLSGKAKGKGTSFDASKIKINIDEDDKCNKQLQEWANKLKNYNLLMKKEYNGNKILQKHFEMVEDTTSSVKRVELKQKKTCQKYIYDGMMVGLYESVRFLYNPVPEKIACKAIDMLKKSTTSDDYDVDDRVIDAKGLPYLISVVNRHTYASNQCGLSISVQGKGLVSLSWSNGENLGEATDEFKRDLKSLTDINKNVYHLSGYYEAQGFGYSWWK